MAAAATTPIGRYASREALREAAMNAGLACSDWTPDDDGFYGLCDGSAYLGVWTDATRELLRKEMLRPEMSGECLFGENWAIAAPSIPVSVQVALGGELIIPADRQTDTSPPAQSAEDAARSAVESTFGTFEPVKKSGKGPGVVKLPNQATAGIVTFTHQGTSSFTLKTVGPSNERGEQLAWGRGGYSGSSVFGLSRYMRQAAKLIVSTSGTWTVKVTPMHAAPMLSVPAKGADSRVFVYAGGLSDWKLTHKGNLNFIVKQYTDESNQVLVNGFGDVTAAASAWAGPNIVTVQADGEWRITELP